MQEYHRRFPDVELTLLELTATQQLEAFDRGQLDVGFSRPKVLHYSDDVVFNLASRLIASQVYISSHEDSLCFHRLLIL